MNEPARNLPDALALRPSTVRFDERSAAVVAEAAKSLNITTAQFIRESAMIRALLVLSDGPEGPDWARKEIDRFREISAEVARLSKV